MAVILVMNLDESVRHQIEIVSIESAQFDGIDRHLLAATYNIRILADGDRHVSPLVASMGNLVDIGNVDENIL